MRDGTKLYTVYYTPDGLKEAAPFLITRTPYGADRTTLSTIKDMGLDGYIFVF